MKTVSIIVPIYNAEQQIKTCVESLLAQTYADIEILLIDDGSTDQTLHICNEFAKRDERIVVIHKENGGVSSARNEGMKNAQGKYIQFVDCDDRLDKNYTETLVAGIENNQADLVISGMVFVKGTEEIRTLKDIYIENQGEWEKEFPYLYKEYFLNAVWNKLFLREKITMPFREDIHLGEDCCFVLDYLKNCSKIQLISSYGYFYMMDSPNSLSKKYNMNEFNNAKLLYRLTKSYSMEKFGAFIGEKEVSYIFFQDLRRLLLEVNKQELCGKSKKINYLKQFALDPVFEEVKDEIKQLGFNQRILFGLLRRKKFTFLLFLMKMVWRDK